MALLLVITSVRRVEALYALVISQSQLTLE